MKTNIRSSKWLIGLSIAITMGGVLTSCQKDWDEPSFENSKPIGNASIQETNVITLAELKARYASQLEKNGYMYEEITDDIQLKVMVTGNDIGSNLYKQICVQDETGGIIVCIKATGLSGELAEGQELLINLKGLCYGGYGSQPQIGTLYTDNGAVKLGQINKYLWNEHIKLLERKEPKKPAEFTAIKDNVKDNCGQLATVRGLKLREASKGRLFAPTYADSIASNYSWIGTSKNYVHHTINMSNGGKIIVRTSTYAKFAAMELPEHCNLTGIFTRYKDSSGDNWQLLIRSADDIEIISEE